MPRPGPSKRYPVTVYERELRPADTVTPYHRLRRNARSRSTSASSSTTSRTIPDLTALFAHLGVETVESCMSFAMTADHGRFEWKGGGETWLETA